MYTVIVTNVHTGAIVASGTFGLYTEVLSFIEGYLFQWNRITIN